MTARARNLALAAILGALRITLRLLSGVVPRSRSVVLSAYPETEGNGLEVARRNARTVTVTSNTRFTVQQLLLPRSTEDV